MLTGVLFLHRITDNRTPGVSTADVSPGVFQMLCGAGGLTNVVLVTTMGDKVEEAVLIKRVADLQDNFWKTMITHGSRVDHSYRYSSKSARGILSKFEALGPPKKEEF